MIRRLLRLLAPLGDLVAGIHLRIGIPKMMPRDYNMVLGMLRPGDVILTKESFRPTNLFIKGRTKHAAMFVGKVSAKDDGIVEATWPEARYTNLISIWQYASDVVVLRPTFTDAAGASDAANAARSLIGTPYDATFAHGEEALYCSELIDIAYKHRLDSLRESHLGADGVILPDALRTSKLFRTIWDSNSKV